MAISGGDGSIILTTKVDEKGLSDGLKKLRGGILSFEKALKGVAVAGAGAFVAVGTAAIKTYADFEQLSGGVQKIFNEIDYSMIEKDAQEAFKTMQMSANQYLEVMTTVGANFASTLGDAKGYEVAKQGMKAITDFATGTGRSVDELSEKYQMITKSTSSYQSIADQFAGILPATSAGFLEQAQAAGFLSDSYTKLTDVPMAEYQEAVTQMLTKGVDALGLTNNAANEATTTLSGSFSMLKGSWSNLLVAFANPEQDLNLAIDDFKDSLSAVADNLLPRIGEVFGSIFGSIPTPILAVASAIGAVVAGITAYNAVMKVKNVLDAIQEAGSIKLALAQIGLNTAMLASPITWVVAGITALVAAFVILWNKSEGFRNFWIGLWEAIKTAVAPVIDWIKEAFSTAWDYIKGVWEQVQPYFSAIWEGIKAVFSVVADVLGAYFETAWSAIQAVWNVVVAYFTMIWENIKAVFSVVKSVLSGDFQGAWEAIKSIWGNVKTFFSTVWENIKSVFSTAMSSFGKIGKNMIEGLWNGIKNAKNWLLGKVKEWCGSILNGIKSFFGIHSPSTVMRDEVGKQIPAGMAIGIEKAKTLVTKATKALITDTRSEVQKVLDDMNEEMLESEKLYAEESIRLKDSTVEADKEYLDNLKKTAETERKLYDARQKDIENLKKNIVDAYSEMANESLSSIEDLEKQQQSLEQKLAEYGGLMVEKTKKVRGKEVTYNVLADLDEQKETLQNYYDMLQTVKERANVPKEFFNVLREMGIDEGLEYANALLQLSDEDFAEYIKDWEEKQKLSQDISKALYEEEAQQLATEISDKFDEVEKEFFGVGENSADEFEDGFMEQLQTVIKNIKRTISSAFSGITPDANYGIGGYSINVPALARGSVLPGGKPFLAIVNDQPRGQTNVEAPLQTIVDAMNIALNNRGGSEIIREEHYNLNETELMTILHKLVKGGERLQGKSLISGGAY